MFFYKQNDPVAAFGSLGGVTYTAKAAGTAGNSITVTYVQGAAGVAAVKASKTITSTTGGSMVITAKTAGTGGNGITFNFTPGPSLSVQSVVGQTVNITYVLNSSTLSALRTLLTSNVNITNLVDVGAITGAGVFVPWSSPNNKLTGGVDAVAAEPTAVTVGGGNLGATAITVRIAASLSLANGVPTIVGIVNAAGTSVTASGTGNLTTKTGAVTLSGGTD
jgi:hypothetical protein